MVHIGTIFRVIGGYLKAGTTEESFRKNFQNKKFFHRSKQKPYKLGSEQKSSQMLVKPLALNRESRCWFSFQVLQKYRYSSRDKISYIPIYPDWSKINYKISYIMPVFLYASDQLFACSSTEKLPLKKTLWLPRRACPLSLSFGPKINPA